MRNEIPINEYELHEPVETGISTSRSFLELQALSQWGATVDDLKAWRDGKMEKSLLDIIYYFYLGDRMFQNHKNDAVAIEQYNRAQRAKKKKG